MIRLNPALKNMPKSSKVPISFKNILLESIINWLECGFSDFYLRFLVTVTAIQIDGTPEMWQRISCFL